MKVSAVANKAPTLAQCAWHDRRRRATTTLSIAVLDSGVDYTHYRSQAQHLGSTGKHGPPYEDDAAGTIQDLHGYNAIDERSRSDGRKRPRHALRGNHRREGGNDIGIAGVNWKVRIMPLKFMNAGGFGTTKDAIEAINYVIDRGRRQV